MEVRAREFGNTRLLFKRTTYTKETAMKCYLKGYW